MVIRFMRGVLASPIRRTKLNLTGEAMTRRLITLLFTAAAIMLLPWWLRGFAAALVLLRLSAYNATIARGLWLRCGQPRPHYITRLALPGLVLSDAENQFCDAKTSSAIVVPGLQYQENDEEPFLFR